MNKISLSTQMSDQDFMIHVLNNLPEEYDVVLDGMESRLLLADSDPNKLTIEDVRAKVNNRFERIEEREGKKGENDDVAFFTKDGKGGGKFEGTCFHCGERGHKIWKCPQYLKMKEKMMKKSEVAKYAIPGYNEELGF